MYSLLILSSEGNITDDKIEELCVKEERCTIAIESRVGRIIPKCSPHQSNLHEHLSYPCDVL